MGNEATCLAPLDGRAGHGKALLESDEVRFRGELRFSIPFAGLSRVDAVDGVLVLDGPHGRAELELGPQAARRAERIRNPKGRIDKLGLKMGMAIAAEGPLPADFIVELATRNLPTASAGPLDALLVACNHLTDVIQGLPDWKQRLAPTGALWIVRPKGRKEISERNVRETVLVSGLVDVKVAKFSETLTAEKFVFRRVDRFPTGGPAIRCCAVRKSCIVSDMAQETNVRESPIPEIGMGPCSARGRGRTGTPCGA